MDATASGVRSVSMAKRQAYEREAEVRRHRRAGGPDVSSNEPRAPFVDAETLAKEALAEYFAILQEWSLNSRPDNALAPDSTAGEP